MKERSGEDAPLLRCRLHSKYKNKIGGFIRHCSVSFWKNVCPSAPALENMSTALPNYLEKCSLVTRQIQKKKVYWACRAWMNDRLGFMTSCNREREMALLFWGQEFIEKFGQTCIVKFACNKLRRIFSKLEAWLDEIIWEPKSLYKSATHLDTCLDMLWIMQKSHKMSFGSHFYPPLSPSLHQWCPGSRTSHSSTSRWIVFLCSLGAIGREELCHLAEVFLCLSRTAELCSQEVPGRPVNEVQIAFCEVQKHHGSINDVF